MANRRLNLNRRLVSVVQSPIIANQRLNQGLNLTLLGRWINSLIGRSKNKIKAKWLSYSVLVLTGKAEKKQRQFRGIGFSIDEYTDQEIMKETKLSPKFVNFHFALCLLAK